MILAILVLTGLVALNVHSVAIPHGLLEFAVQARQASAEQCSNLDASVGGAPEPISDAGIPEAQPEMNIPPGICNSANPCCKAGAIDQTFDCDPDTQRRFVRSETDGGAPADAELERRDGTEKLRQSGIAKKYAATVGLWYVVSFAGDTASLVRQHIESAAGLVPTGLAVDHLVELWLFKAFPATLVAGQVLASGAQAIPLDVVNQIKYDFIVCPVVAQNLKNLVNSVVNLRGVDGRINALKYVLLSSDNSNGLYTWSSWSLAEATTTKDYLAATFESFKLICQTIEYGFNQNYGYAVGTAFATWAVNKFQAALNSATGAIAPGAPPLSQFKPDARLSG